MIGKGEEEEEEDREVDNQLDGSATAEISHGWLSWEFFYQNVRVGSLGLTVRKQRVRIYRSELSPIYLFGSKINIFFFSARYM